MTNAANRSNGWLQTVAHASIGIPFNRFKKIIAKLPHAFTVIPEGQGLLSPCKKILSRKPP